MSYKLRPKNPAAEVRKVARQRIDKAIEALGVPPAERGEGVHKARKRFKELRALLRLVREPLGDEFKHENRRVRDLGRMLAESRDATAMLESWDLLMQRFAERLGEPASKQTRQRLQASARQAEGNAADLDDRIAQAVSELHAVKASIDSWPLDATGFGLLAAGVERTYADGAAELAKVRSEPSDEQFHEWRKRVKDHWYQAQLLTPSWPMLMRLRADSLKRLADLLGDDHDLAMMQYLLREQPQLFGDQPVLERLGPAIAERRSELQRAALGLGDELYREAPRDLAARWRRYWDAAEH
ncbi:CHAD domain-containing protein [Pseudomonas sp. SST3]|uniref:CHAD domain-containing protein n=1 Tax=Pseudomonas sp. SST3 TaxID=2267882 RepID=UPI000E03DDAA|nr:CHAD domain-containing protein [Pseudomonas sp. SST3]NKQ11954.1 CHAD domain-containing protein [Pseudomonas sp. SST3]